MSKQSPGSRLGRALGAAFTVAIVGTCVQALPAAAQDGWNPFGEASPPGSARRTARPAPEATRPPHDAAPPTAFGAREAVERTDLPPLPGHEQPIGAPAASANPNVGSASSAAAARLAGLAPELALPLRSAAISRLFSGLIGPSAGEAATGEEAATRAAALYRSGRIAEADALMMQHARRGGEGGTASLVMVSLAARSALATGDWERACGAAQAVVQAEQQLPAALRAEAIAIGGTCGARAGNPAAAGLAAGLVREVGGLPAETLAALDAVGSGEPPTYAPTPSPGHRLGVLDWRLAELAGKLEQAPIPLDRLEPSALASVALSRTAPPRLRTTAAEAAARLNAIDPATLLEVYRQLPFTAPELADAQGGRAEPWSRRALLVRAAEAERTPFKRTRLIRAALDDARRTGLYPALAAALAPIVEDIRPVPEIGWFAETAVEVMVAAGRLDQARRWAQTGAEASGVEGRAAVPLAHWLALIDIADPALRSNRGAPLESVEQLALRGRFTADGLHRLATVLDALDFHVPMRLWEAASRAPQPTSGHLPPTGVLSELQAAARARDTARTAFLVLRALGPDGPEGAHMIALGDTIRALRRAGLEAHARVIAAEALFALWPRVASG